MADTNIPIQVLPRSDNGPIIAAEMVVPKKVVAQTQLTTAGPALGRSRINRLNRPYDKISMLAFAKQVKKINAAAALADYFFAGKSA